MSLKFLNVLGLALVFHWFSTGSPGRRARPPLLWAALLDAWVLISLMAFRGAAETASGATLGGIQWVHIGASMVFPLLYPFLIFPPRSESEAESLRVITWLELSFLATRTISTLTSYFMAELG